MNAIKQKLKVSTFLGNTFLTLSPSVVRNMLFDNDSAIQASLRQNPTLFEEDKTAPELVFFTLDLNEGSMHLTFSVTVDSTTLNISSLIFVANSNIPAAIFPVAIFSACTP